MNYLVIGSTVSTAADGRIRATFSPDGTTPGLLAPEAGGFILVNGGAAARRFDATGGLVAAIGYGLPAPDDSLASSAAALLGGDQLLIADAGAVRLYDAGWSTLWEHDLSGAAAITAAHQRADMPLAVGRRRPGDDFALGDLRDAEVQTGPTIQSTLNMIPRHRAPTRRRPRDHSGIWNPAIGPKSSSRVQEDVGLRSRRRE